MTEIDSSKNVNSGSINADGNVSIGDRYKQIYNIFKKNYQGIDSMNIFLPEGFLNTLPSIKYYAYKKAQPLWDSGITSNMIEGNSIVIDKLLQIYLDLVELVEKDDSINGVPVRDYYENKIRKYSDYVHDAIDKDAGNMQIILSGGEIIDIIQDCIVYIVKECTANSYFSKWLDSWNSYEEELHKRLNL